MSTDPTLLGTVQDVNGPTISVALDHATVVGLALIEGHGYRIGQLGSFVRVPMGYLDLYGVVSQVGAGAVPEHGVPADPHGYRWMTVQLVGEGQRRGEFRRGVSQHPTVGDSVHLLVEDDLARIYGRPDALNFVRLGHVANAESIPALIDVNKLICRHSAIVGTTGAGKSTTVASLLVELSDGSRYPSARILVLDIHGEYGAALEDRAQVFRVNSERARGALPLHIPYWAMNFDELLSVTFGQLEDAAHGAVLEKVRDMKLASLRKKPRDGVTEDNLTVDTPIPFSIHRLWLDLHRLVNATHKSSGGQSEATEALLLDEKENPVQPGDAMQVIPPKYRPQTQAAGEEKIYLSSSLLNLRRSIEILASKLRDPRFDFLFRPGSWCPNTEGVLDNDLDSLLKQWVAGPKPITILDLSGVPAPVVTDLVGVLLRIVYDALFWGRNLSEGGRERPLLVVLEEAHQYLGQGDKGPAAVAARRIVKEGRKYGVGAMIVSQRPSEVDTTILSQCGTIFAMRLSNTSDRAHVRGVVTDNLEGLLNGLPVLRTGEVIVVGEAVHLPVRALVSMPRPNRRPDSLDPLVYEAKGPGGWNRDREPSNYAELVELWRSQFLRSPSIVTSELQEGVREVNRIPVASSNLASVGYHLETQTLEIEFNDGSVYQYFDVPERIHETLIDASSKGSFLNSAIKGAYRYAKL